MKNSILTLFAVALSFGAMAQSYNQARTTGNTGLSGATPLNLIYQGPYGDNNKVEMTQNGNTKLEITQEGINGTIQTFQDVDVNDGGNAVFISQIGLRNDVQAFQLGTLGGINLLQSGNDNIAIINQTGTNDDFSLTQAGNKDKVEITQGQMQIGAVREGGPSTGNILEVKQNNGVSASDVAADGSELEILQWGTTNLIRLEQSGSLNKLTVTQSGESNIITGFEGPGSLGEQIGNSNEGILKQSGNNNTIMYSQTASNTYVDALQSGSGNLAQIMVRNINNVQIP
jgi:hypothetical protein